MFDTIHNNFLSQNYQIYRKTNFVLLPSRAPPTALLPKARYERIIEAFGGKGYFAETPTELRTVLRHAFEETEKRKKPVLINVMISPSADRRPQVIGPVQDLVT